MNGGIAPMRAAICCEGVTVISFVAGVELGSQSTGYERKQKSQTLANLRLKDRRALSCLAVAGDDVFPAVLLDWKGFTAANFVARVVRSRPRRMVSLDDSISGGGMVGGTLPVRP